MVRFLLVPALATTVLNLQGCPFFQQQTTVELRNETAFPVEVDVFIDDEQLIPEELLEETDPDLAVTLAPGEVRSLTDNCDEVQAVLVRGDVQIIGGIGPSESTGVFRDGDDFGCGDRLTFTFTLDALGTDLDIGFSRSD